MEPLYYFMKNNTFEKKYHSKTKRTRFSSQLKSPTFRGFRLKEHNDEYAFKKYWLKWNVFHAYYAMLARDRDRTDETLWDFLWKPVQGETLELFGQTIQRIEFFFTSVVEGISYAIDIYRANKGTTTLRTLSYMIIMLIISLMMRYMRKKFILTTVMTIWMMVTHYLQINMGLHVIQVMFYEIENPKINELIL